MSICLFTELCTERLSSQEFSTSTLSRHSHCQSNFTAPPTTPFRLNPSQQRVTASPLRDPNFAPSPFSHLNGLGAGACYELKRERGAPWPIPAPVERALEIEFGADVNPIW